MTDFLIVTALMEERDAVLSKLGQATPIAGSATRKEICFAAAIDSPGGLSYSVKVLSIGGMGRVRAALATNNAIREWHPQYVLLVGIAGGFAPNAGLGDVLISDQIMDYELQKVGPETHEFRPSYPPVSHRLLNAAQNFANYGGSTWRDQVAQVRPDAGQPKVVCGPVATGDKVVNQPDLLAKLKALNPRLVGVEMEAGGAAWAAHQDETGFLMVRGVSDSADGGKDAPGVRQWRQYACDVAAAYAVGLLQTGWIGPGREVLERETAAIREIVANIPASVTPPEDIRRGIVQVVDDMCDALQLAVDLLGKELSSSITAYVDVRDGKEEGLRNYFKRLAARLSEQNLWLLLHEGRVCGELHKLGDRFNSGAGAQADSGISANIKTYFSQFPGMSSVLHGLTEGERDYLRDFSAFLEQVRGRAEDLYSLPWGSGTQLREGGEGLVRLMRRRRQGLQEKVKELRKTADSLIDTLRFGAAPAQ